MRRWVKVNFELAPNFTSGFKIPLIARLEMPNPTPQSNSCDVVDKWTVGS